MAESIQESNLDRGQCAHAHESVEFDVLYDEHFGLIWRMLRALGVAASAIDDAVQDVFLTKKRLSEADLYEAPLTSFGRNAVDRFFTPAEIKEIVALAGHVAA